MSIDPLSQILRLRNNIIHIFGLPGTFKTSFLFFLTQSIIRMTSKRKIFIIDIPHNFPVSRMKGTKKNLQQIILFRPNNLYEQIYLLDDLEIYLDQESFLFIDDLFRLVNRNDDNYIKETSLLLTLISKTSNNINFPVLITNQARMYDQGIYPSFSSIIDQYILNSLLFTREKDKNSLKVEYFKKKKNISEYEYELGREGVKFALDFLI